MVPVFGEVSNELLVITNLMTAAVAAAVPWTVNAFRTSRADRRRELKEDEKSILDRQDSLIQRLSHEITVSQTQRERLSIQFTQVLAHMMYLEGILESKNVKFRKFPLDTLPNPAGAGSSEVEPAPTGREREDGVE